MRLRLAGSAGSLRNRLRRALPACGRSALLLFLAACALQTWTACNKRDPNEDPKIRTGRVLYQASCSACHNRNPGVDGALGPSVKGSSLELLKARVLHGTYPPGYTPKRDTKVMVKLPLTEPDVEAIHAFLNAP